MYYLRELNTVSITRQRGPRDNRSYSEANSLVLLPLLISIAKEKMSVYFLLFYICIFICISERLKEITRPSEQCLYIIHVEIVHCLKADA